MILAEIHQQDWFNYLNDCQKRLLEQSLVLSEEVTRLKEQFYDYSFLVMSASKAYEGFIKDFLLKHRLISQKRHDGKRFRVGKALNPAIAENNPDGFENLFDDLIELFGGKEIPMTMWETWKECRNEVFHYFQNQEKAITLVQAKEKIEKIIETIRLVYEFDKIIQTGYRYGM